MKFKSLLVVLIAGMVCLPFRSYGQDGIASLRQKAEQGSARAQFYLGSNYDVGRGVPQDSKEAARWYRLAAEQGFSIAQSNLGRLYASGHGVPQDFAQAYAWINIAAAQGDNVAVEDLPKIMKAMTPSQIEEGQRLSREYAEKFIIKKRATRSDAP